jgi:hypothetical protein
MVPRWWQQRTFALATMVGKKGTCPPYDTGVLKSIMAIQSTFLGSTTITGEDAKVFNRLVTHGRSNQAAKASLANGRRLAATFLKKGAVTINLKPARKPSC